MNVTASDYTWFRERYPDVAQAYCITLVRGLLPEAVLGRLGATELRRATGTGSLIEPAYETWDMHSGDRLFVAVTELGGWAVMIEANGYLGVTAALAQPLSRGTWLVAHFRNVNAVDHFYWYADGELRLHFEPLFPDSRDGSDPDGLVEEMRAAGFDLTGGGGTGLHTEAAFALAERVTGVRLTREFLDAAEFTTGTVVLPR